MARRRNTVGTIENLKPLLDNPQFRDILLSGGKLQAKDIPLNLRPEGIQEQQAINLSDVGRTQAANILGEETQRANINKLADLRAALVSQARVRANAGQQITPDEINRITQRFLPTQQQLIQQISQIPQQVTPQVKVAGIPQPIATTATTPTVAIGQRVLGDTTRTGGAEQRIRQTINLGIQRLRQTGAGGLLAGPAGATAVATEPSLTPSNPLPEDIIPRTLKDIQTGATKVLKGTTLEEEAVNVLKSIDPKLGKLKRSERRQLAGLRFKNPRTNQVITITPEGGFQVIS